MDEILVIFDCEGLTVYSDFISERYVEQFIDDVCMSSQWTLVEILEFTGFIFVEVK